MLNVAVRHTYPRRVADPTYISQGTPRGVGEAGILQDWLNPDFVYWTVEESGNRVALAHACFVHGPE